MVFPDGRTSRDAGFREPGSAESRPRPLEPEKRINGPGAGMLPRRQQLTGSSAVDPQRKLNGSQANLPTGYE